MTGLNPRQHSIAFPSLILSFFYEQDVVIDLPSDSPIMVEGITNLLIDYALVFSY